MIGLSTVFKLNHDFKAANKIANSKSLSSDSKALSDKKGRKLWSLSKAANQLKGSNNDWRDYLNTDNWDLDEIKKEIDNKIDEISENINVDDINSKIEEFNSEVTDKIEEITQKIDDAQS